MTGRGEVVGVDHNMRRAFLGPAGDTLCNLEQEKVRKVSEVLGKWP